MTSYHLVRQNLTINISDLEEANVDNTEEVSNDVLDEQPNEQSTAFRAGLPTALNVNVDYRITGNLYANLTWIQGMRNRNAIAMRQNALVALTPRLETKLLEVSLPLSFQDNYSNFAAGFAFRFGAFS